MGRLIDADALIDDIKNNLWDWETVDGITATTVLKQTISDIRNQPVIEERKTGKWIIEPYDAQNDIFIHRCGTCMRVAMLGGHTTKFKYCPLCGSAMTEGEQP